MSRRVTQIALAACVLAAGLVLAAPASARTIRLGWTEKTPAPYYGFIAMTFKVRSVTVTPSGWSVQAEMINRSGKRITFRRATSFFPPRVGFGLRAPRPRVVGRRDFVELRATTFTPSLPESLEPGRRWSGRFSGRGRLPRRKPITVTFGVFLVNGTDPFSWETQRRFRL
jgi:hypothetical protein